MIELVGVTKQYLYGARVLGAVDLKIPDGQKLALLGDVGSGKTTFIKVASSVTDCEGSVLLDGQPVTSKTDDIIVIFDDLAVFKNRTFYYNLAYPLKIRGYDKADTDRLVKSAAERMGITACLYEKVKKMPLIDVKRLALARLYIRDAKAVFIDDVTSGLSEADSRTLWQETERIICEQARQGKSVVYSTSSRTQAMSVSDKIAVMHYGEIKQIGSASDIWDRPDNVWAAEALDSCYHFERARLDCTNGSLTLTLGVQTPVSSGDEYVLDADCFKGKIADSYFNQTVIVGWHGSDYAEAGDREDVVDYAEFDGSGYILHTLGGHRVRSADKKDRVCTLPDIGKARLFDFTNENSIHKNATEQAKE